MARIDPIPYDELSDDARRRMSEGTATGMYTTIAPLQVVARSAIALEAMDDAYRAIFKRGVLGQRLQELLRIRSAQLNMCAPCGESRKDESLTDDDIACLVDPSRGGADPRESLALSFLELFATDHHSIGDEMFRELKQHFTDEEIVELGYLCSQFVGGHRFMHILDVMR
jgi:alkylhydroperoxidase family enzyme